MVFDPYIDGIAVMVAAAMRYPLVIDHLAGVVESGVSDNLGMAVPQGVAPDCPSLAAVLDDAGRPLFNELLFARRRPTYVASTC